MNILQTPILKWLIRDELIRSLLSGLAIFSALPYAGIPTGFIRLRIRQDFSECIIFQLFHDDNYGRNQSFIPVLSLKPHHAGDEKGVGIEDLLRK